MKLRHLFATLSLAIVAGAGVAAGLSSGSAQKAEAADAAGDTTIYLDFGDTTWWNSADAVTKVKLSNNTVLDANYTDVSFISGNRYKFTLPKDYDQFYVARLNKDNLAQEFNRTVLVSYEESYNFLYVKDDKTGTYNNVAYNNSVAYVQNGEKLYATIDDYNKNWDFSKNVSLYFFNNNDGTNTLVNGSRVSDSYTYEFTMSGNYFAQAVIVVRHTGTSLADQWSNVDRQSVNIWFNHYSNQTSRAFVVKNNDDAQCSYTAEDKIEVNYFAKAFSCYFLVKTNGYCTSSMAGSISDIQSAFNTFDALWVANGGTANDVKSAFLTAEITRGYDVPFGNNYTAQAISRYANMVEGSYTTAFLGAYSGSSGALVPMMAGDKSKYTVAVIIASLVALTAIGGFFFIRRKRA